ncbi:MAG: OmpA family protein [Acidobacteria bacterium]|nr:OmpA family protein [Acidobacteriota bacterium]MBI3662965.1 OmpA family protein [Acidobacteriota bacterium]
MSRKKKHAEHVNHERWLVSYADFITLLFAFFVVMFASAQVDQRKVGRLAMAIQVAFQELGIFETSNTHMPLANSEPMPFSTVQSVENVAHTESMSQVAGAPKRQLSPSPEQGQDFALRSQLKQALAKELLRGDVDLALTREGLVIRLREVGFFDSGSPTIRPQSIDSVARIAGILGQYPVNVRIEGHTDNVPIHTGRFPSNWELSTTRATEITRLFITRFGFSPQRLSAAGFAEFHPVSENDTPDGRAANRRVDIVVHSAAASSDAARPEQVPQAGLAPPHPSGP